MPPTPGIEPGLTVPGLFPDRGDVLAHAAGPGPTLLADLTSSPRSRGRVVVRLYSRPAMRFMMVVGTPPVSHLGKIDRIY
jgi:hypothetical protein